MPSCWYVLEVDIACDLQDMLIAYHRLHRLRNWSSAKRWTPFDLCAWVTIGNKDPANASGQHFGDSKWQQTVVPSIIWSLPTALYSAAVLHCLVSEPLMMCGSLMQGSREFRHPATKEDSSGFDWVVVGWHVQIGSFEYAQKDPEFKLGPPRSKALCRL